jgi:hypothetical protein
VAADTISIFTLVGAFAFCFCFCATVCRWQELMAKTTATSIKITFFIIQMLDFVCKGREKQAIFRVRLRLILYQFSMKIPKQT